MDSGLCECGCGGKTSIATHSDSRKGWVKNHPVRFLLHHKPSGAKHWRWKGGIRPDGYLQEKVQNHPRAKNTAGRICIHVLIAEKAIGKYLPDGAVVHHFDGKRTNNVNNNLVICQDQTYHQLLHRRQRALAACGHPDWLRCTVCKTYDTPSNLRTVELSAKPGTILQSYHLDCMSEHWKKWKEFK